MGIRQSGGSPTQMRRRAPAPSGSDRLTMEVFRGVEFRGIGPSITTGRVSDLEVDPNDGNVWYLGEDAASDVSIDLATGNLLEGESGEDHRRMLLAPTSFADEMTSRIVNVQMAPNSRKTAVCPPPTKANYAPQKTVKGVFW